MVEVEAVLLLLFAHLLKLQNGWKELIKDTLIHKLENQQHLESKGILICVPLVVQVLEDLQQAVQIQEQLLLVFKTLYQELLPVIEKQEEK